jgi:hypothetical protein
MNSIATSHTDRACRSDESRFSKAILCDIGRTMRQPDQHVGRKRRFCNQSMSLVAKTAAMVVGFQHAIAGPRIAARGLGF